MATTSLMNTKIDADDKTLVEILKAQKFSIDYFQREYRWERKHIEQLIDDLETAFLNNYDPDHEREEVENYNSYYMGPLVMSNKEGKLSIIDGQQRLTSLTLLLVYLNHLQKDLSDKEAVDDLIFSEKFGKKSYNMQVPEREKCLDGLYLKGQYTPADDDDESVNNLVSRYADIVELFPAELKDEALLFFISWLKEKIVFVKIVSYSEENAYTIFETMNDRGMNLSPSDMLKGFLLSKITDTKKKNELNARWKKRIAELHEYSQQEDLEFFKAWLRAKYAETIRPGKKGSSNEDFEKIGTYFHTWVKDKQALIGLNGSNSYVDFVENQFDTFSKVYLKILDAQNDFIQPLSTLYYTSYFGIATSLAYPLLLAPIKHNDNEEIQDVKLQMVAHYIECFSVYRAINQRTLGQSSLRYTLYTLVKEIRNKTVKQLASILKSKMNDFEEDLSGISNFNLHQQNRRFVRFFLARLTNHVENESGINSSIDDYLSDSIKKPAQIEHIWANDFESHTDEFKQENDFNFYRNSLGDLLLLPKGTNQSFSDDAYSTKVPHYLKQNLLAQSLHKDCYIKNPNFTSWVKKVNLPFKPFDEFKKDQIEEREDLYRQIAEMIWSSDFFDNLVATHNI